MNIRFFTTTAAMALLSACAATPPPPTPPAPATTVVAAVPTAATASAATASSGPNEHTKYLAKKAKELDYQVETRKGQVFYCQTSAQVSNQGVSERGGF